MYIVCLLWQLYDPWCHPMPPLYWNSRFYFFYLHFESVNQMIFSDAYKENILIILSVKKAHKDREDMFNHKHYWPLTHSWQEVGIFNNSWTDAFQKNKLSISPYPYLCCQAQPQPQVKLSLKAELALISFNPATPTLTPPPATWESLFSNFS